MREQRRIGDRFREPRVSDALKRQYLCDHVKIGTPVVKRYDTPYGMVAACEKCQGLETLRLTDDGRVV
jgi:hypothetical protein